MSNPMGWGEIYRVYYIAYFEISEDERTQVRAQYYPEYETRNWAMFFEDINSGRIQNPATDALRNQVILNRLKA